MPGRRTVEVELRGRLSEEGFSSLGRFLARNGKYLGKEKRVTIVFRTFGKVPGVSDRLDVRVRASSNGKEELVLKERLAGDSGAGRRETVISLARGEARKAVEFVASLGFRRGSIAYRRLRAYKYKGIHFSLGEVPDHSFYYEAEIMTGGRGAKAAEARIRRTLASMGLPVFSGREFREFITDVTRNANKAFDFRRHGTRGIDFSWLE